MDPAVEFAVWCEDRLLFIPLRRLHCTEEIRPINADYLQKMETVMGESYVVSNFRNNHKQILTCFFWSGLFCSVGRPPCIQKNTDPFVVLRPTKASSSSVTSSPASSFDSAELSSFRVLEGNHRIQALRNIGKEVGFSFSRLCVKAFSSHFCWVGLGRKDLVPRWQARVSSPASSTLSWCAAQLGILSNLVFGFGP